MTKHTDSSRSIDSGVSGNVQTSAKEIRKWNKHDEPLSRLGGHNPYWCGGSFAGDARSDDPCWTCIDYLHEAAEKSVTEREREFEIKQLIEEARECAERYRDRTIEFSDIDALERKANAAEKAMRESQ